MARGGALKPRSDNRRRQEARYARDNATTDGEHRFCVRCLLAGRQVAWRERHHLSGREGERLRDRRFIVTLCGPCHAWTEQEPASARAEGFVLTRLIPLDQLAVSEEYRTLMARIAEAERTAGRI